MDFFAADLEKFLLKDWKCLKNHKVLLLFQPHMLDNRVEYNILGADFLTCWAGV